MSGRNEKQPSLVGSTLLVVGLTVVWSWLRLLAFKEMPLPLTFVLPMLVCVWSRRAWQLWGMAAVFAVVTVMRYQQIVADDVMIVREARIFFGTTMLNVIAGAAVVQAILMLRNRLDAQKERLREQYAELEAQSEELARQNEEIKEQSEELAQQNEEIESQSEELGRQNEELQRANDRLAIREEILQSLLEVTRKPGSGLEALADVCQRSLHAIGRPAECVAVLRLDPDKLRLKSQAMAPGAMPVPAEWPREGSIASVVLAAEKTAYVSDLRLQPELRAPFGENDPVRSVLATPLRVGGALYGVVVACSAEAAHWTEEQFHVLEWIAAQCGMIAEGIRWQRVLAERTREIEAANRAKDQFLAMLSHELRTPLTPVLAAAGELERDERVPEDVREDLQMIRRNVAIQSRLIDDLLDLTRLERGKLKLDTSALDLASLLQETTSIVAGDLDAKDQRVELNLDGVRGCRVEGDGPRLQQVFWNLLKNANKFSPRQSVITMKARRVAGRSRVRVEVKDAGLGIEADDLKRIFKPFEQVERMGKQRGSESGLGLGLAIAKALVELHRGTIAVASDGAGQGATFSVELPILDEVAPEPSRGAVTRSPFRGSEGNNGVQILLVEDHEDTGRVLARLLRNSGYAVDYARSAGAAWELFQKARYALVISDLGLPDESGLELIRRMKARRPDLPGICLSGYGAEEDLQACRAAGFSEHLTKPVDMQRLHAAIGRILAGERS